MRNKSDLIHLDPPYAQMSSRKTDKGDVLIVKFTSFSCFYTVKHVIVEHDTSIFMTFTFFTNFDNDSMWLFSYREPARPGSYRSYPARANQYR